MLEIKTISLQEILSARQRLTGIVQRTPLLRLNLGQAPAEIYLKVETLQHTGSFKIRGAGNAMALLGTALLNQGVWTASEGNMGPALAWLARRKGIPCSVFVTDSAPESLLNSLSELGAQVVALPPEEYDQVLHSNPSSSGLSAFDLLDNANTTPGLFGHMVHPFVDPAVIAGNGTIGLEILEELPDVSAILAPFGGGGLSCGIASAVRTIQPHVQVIACEINDSAPLNTSLSSGKIEELHSIPGQFNPRGYKTINPRIWPLAQRILDGSLVVSPSQVVSAMSILATRNHLISEIHGAVALASALNALPLNLYGRKIVCVVSGGNIETGQFVKVIQGENQG